MVKKVEEKKARMKELVEILNKAGRAYYQEAEEQMSNYEYDKLYDELLQLERQTNIVLANSPSIHVGYEVLSELPKETHEKPMLSLDKTKQVEILEEWLGEKEGLLSWKLDGLTIVLTYENGALYKAITRGNGQVGEVITNNAKVFQNIPLTIPFQGKLILRGEALIQYSDFKKMNEQISEVEAKYKNPRNLCSGSVRQLNNEITAQRNVYFYAFALVEVKGEIEESTTKTRLAQMKWIKEQGFDVVYHKLVTRETIKDTVAWFFKEIPTFDLPSDGLVLIYNDIAYGTSLGHTAKFPRDSIAYKWKDEIAATTLKEMEWSASRTGLINPVAIFEPVELEGTTISRASVHNISIVEQLQLGIGDTIEVYKANMVIPQIADNKTKSGTLEIPETCPVCGGKTEIKQENGVKSLYCINEKCLAKKIKSFTHFVSRDAMNIDGLSEATIEKLIAKGFIKELADIFHVETYHDEIVQMDGFGEKSFFNLKNSIEKARNVFLFKFIYSLGIPNIGLSNAKLICKQFQNDLTKIKKATKEELIEISGVGEVIADTFIHFWESKENQEMVKDLEQEVQFLEEKKSLEEQSLEGMQFVITGSLSHFENRTVLKNIIETKGGKVTGNVTSKTNYLINNDTLSSSSKNKKAKELAIPIITEEEFLKMIEKE